MVMQDFTAKYGKVSAKQCLRIVGDLIIFDDKTYEVAAGADSHTADFTIGEKSLTISVKDYLIKTNGTFTVFPEKLMQIFFDKTK